MELAGRGLGVHIPVVVESVQGLSGSPGLDESTGVLPLDIDTSSWVSTLHLGAYRSFCHAERELNAVLGLVLICCFSSFKPAIGRGAARRVALNSVVDSQKHQGSGVEENSYITGAWLRPNRGIS